MYVRFLGEKNALRVHNPERWIPLLGGRPYVIIGTLIRYRRHIVILFPLVKSSLELLDPVRIGQLPDDQSLQ